MVRASPLPSSRTSHAIAVGSRGCILEEVAATEVGRLVDVAEQLDEIGETGTVEVSVSSAEVSSVSTARITARAGAGRRSAYVFASASATELPALGPCARRRASPSASTPRPPSPYGETLAALGGRFTFSTRIKPAATAARKEERLAQEVAEVAGAPPVFRREARSELRDGKHCCAERIGLALTSSRRREHPQGGHGSRPGPRHLAAQVRLPQIPSLQRLSRPRTRTCALQCPGSLCASGSVRIGWRWSRRASSLRP